MTVGSATPSASTKSPTFRSRRRLVGRVKTEIQQKRLFVSDISINLTVKMIKPQRENIVSTARRSEDLPTPEIAGMARESAARIARLLQKQPEADRARVRLDGEEIILPRAAVALLRDLLTEMAQGRAVNLIPVHAELTTQQAADLLNVSRPHLVKLVDQNKIPYSMVGTHRRIRLQDLLDYQQRQQDDSGEALNELAKQAQEIDLGY